MLPGQTEYTTITADEVIFRGRDYPDPDDNDALNHFINDPYICFKDITSEVQDLDTEYGKYQVANVEAKLGSLSGHNGGTTGTSGGWQIIMVYKSDKLFLFMKAHNYLQEILAFLMVMLMSQVLLTTST